MTLGPDVVLIQEILLDTEHLSTFIVLEVDTRLSLMSMPWNLTSLAQHWCGEKILLLPWLPV